MPQTTGTPTPIIRKYRIPFKRGTKQRERADRRQRELALNLLWGFAQQQVDGPVVRETRPCRTATDTDTDTGVTDPAVPDTAATDTGDTNPQTGRAWTWRAHDAHDLRKTLLADAANARRAREAHRDAAPAPEWDLPPLAPQQLVPGSDYYGLCF